MFEYALLDFLHAVVIVIQYLLGTMQIQVVLGIFVPGERYKRLQIIDLDVEVWTLWLEVVELVALFMENLLNLLRPFLPTGLAQQLGFLGRLLVAHLGLHVLDLLLQEVVLLLLVNVLAGLVANVCLQLLKIDLPIQALHGTKEALLDGLNFQELDFLLDGERHVGAQEAQHHLIVLDVADGKQGLVRDLVNHLDVLLCNLL